jgi:antitoxin (DNA-binding transcriptional repressor) of toxin-antitoxin stability system
VLLYQQSSAAVSAGSRLERSIVLRLIQKRAFIGGAFSNSCRSTKKISALSFVCSTPWPEAMNKKDLAMLTITTDELAAHTHEYISRVIAGEAIAILDHGRAVARLVAVAERTLPAALARAVADGSVVLPIHTRLTTTEAPPIPGGGASTADFVSNDRR